MKTKALVGFLALVSITRVSAQGFILDPSATLPIGFNTIDRCQTTEFSPGTCVAIAFGQNLLEPGESLRVEMFENTLSESPFATQTFTPSSSLTSVAMYGPRSQWLDHQGLVRLTMLSGSTEIGGAYFITSPDLFTFCSASVPVPEPRSIVLVLIAIVFGAFTFVSCHRRQNLRERN